MAESDLERRVARLERGVQLALGRARRVSAAIDRTTSAVNVRRVPLPPVVGPPVQDVPCCPGRQAPAALTVRCPNGETVSLPFVPAFRQWIGNATFADASLWSAWYDGANCRYNPSNAPFQSGYPVQLAVGCTPSNVVLTAGGQTAIPMVGSLETLRAITTPTGFFGCSSTAVVASGPFNAGQCNPMNAVLSTITVVRGIPFGLGAQFLVYET